MSNKDEIEQFGELKDTVGKARRNTMFMTIISMMVGISFAHLFNHLNISNHFIAAIGLYSQVIGFGAAILLSSQFMNIPEKLFGVHNLAVAFVMSLPTYVWLSARIYVPISMVGGFAHSEVWMLVTAIPFWGIGMVIFAFGRIQDVVNFEVSDKKLVTGIGWYLVLFSLGLQVYLSLMNLEILKVPFDN